MDKIMPGRKILLSPPVIDQRNPSITPTIGLIEYNNLHFSGILLLLKPTGDMYIPNCTTNGTMYLKSRYLTFRAATYNPAPMADKNANPRNKGR